MASSPCQLDDDDDEYSEVEIIISQSVIGNKSQQKGIILRLRCALKQILG